MKSLSQSKYGELRSLYENVYAPKFESILDEFTDEDLDDLTDEYIEEQVTEFFQECLEEGLDIEIVEQTICESIDSSLDLLTERVDPKETRRRIDQAKDRLETGRAMRSAAAKSAAKSSSDSSDKKANRLAQIKGAVKKVGKAVQGGVGLAARAVGTAQRAGSALKSAAKSGYERGKQGSSSGSSTSSAGTSSSGSSTSSAGTSSSDSSSSSGGGSSSSAPASRRRKDGLLKRGLKKLVRGVSKGVSAAAGAVKAGADSITDRARKEQMNYKDFKTIQELYNSIYEPQQVDEELINEDSRRMSNKQHTKRVRSNIKSFGSNYTPPSNYDPDANRGQGEVLTRKQIEKKRRKALRQEELEATGLFTVKEIEAIMEAEMIDENRAAMGRINREFHRKNEAEAMAARARDPKVKRDLPKRKNDNPMYDPKSAGSSRVSGFKFTPTEDVEYVGEGLTGERYKAALKKGKQYSRMVSADPKKRATRGGRGGESDFGAGDRGAGNKAARRAGTYQEEYVDEAQHARENPEKYEREQAKKSAPVRGERTPMPPRGDKRREDFEKWYAKQMGR